MRDRQGQFPQLFYRHGIILFHKLTDFQAEIQKEDNPSVKPMGYIEFYLLLR